MNDIEAFELFLVAWMDKNESMLIIMMVHRGIESGKRVSYTGANGKGDDKERVVDKLGTSVTVM